MLCSYMLSSEGITTALNEIEKIGSSKITASICPVMVLFFVDKG